MISIDWIMAAACVSVCSAAYSAFIWLERREHRRLAGRQRPTPEPEVQSAPLYDIVNPDEHAEDFVERYSGKPVLRYAPQGGGRATKPQT